MRELGGRSGEARRRRKADGKKPRSSPSRIGKGRLPLSAGRSSPATRPRS